MNMHVFFLSKPMMMMMMIVGHFGMVWLGTLVHGNKEIEVAIKKIRGIGEKFLPEKYVFV